MNICVIFAGTQTNRARNLQIYIHEPWFLGLSSNGVNGYEQIRLHDDLSTQKEYPKNLYELQKGLSIVLRNCMFNLLLFRFRRGKICFQ